MTEANTTFLALRVHQLVLIVSTLLVSWLGMMIVHEFGHVLVAMLSGGKIERVILHPLVFSRTDLSVNPHPLLVAWGGPVMGCVLPLIAYGAAAAFKVPGHYLLRFFAGFCLIANGGYIGIGSIDRVGDTYQMLLFGSQRWQLWLFGLVASAGGFCLWHRLGSSFGIGPTPKRVAPLAAYAMASLLVVIVCTELLLVRMPL